MNAAEPPVLARIRAALPELRPSQRRVADLFLADPPRAAKMSVAAIAEQAATSTASVVRFSKHMGYAHLREFRADVLGDAAREDARITGLPEVSGDIDRHDTLDDVVAKISLAETGSLADTARMLDISALRRAVDALARASRVDIFGVSAGALVATDLQRKLTRIGRVALDWADSHSGWPAATTLRPGSVAIAISHSGTTLDTIEFLALAGRAGATTIAITNHEDSPLGKTADIVLTTAARETQFRSGALGSRIAQLMVVDCLFIGVAQANYDDSMAAIRDTYAAVQPRKSPR